MKEKYNNLTPKLKLFADLVPLKMLSVNINAQKSTNEYLMLKNKYNFRIPFTSIDFALQSNSTAVLVQLKPCSLDILLKWNRMFRYLGLVESTTVDIINTSEALLENKALMTQQDYYLIETKPFSHLTGNFLKTTYINHDFRDLKNNEQKPFIAQVESVGIKWDREWLVYKTTT